MDLITFCIIMFITVWLVVVSLFICKLLKAQEAQRIKHMLLDARVNKYVDFGNPVKMKVRPLMGKRDEVTIDFSELDDEGIL